ncbi:MAG: SDR family oxidoreductase [Solirubrobacterales bacterium]
MSEGRVAVVTGAGSGIGAATAKALAEAGLKVAIAGRSEDKLNAVRDDIVASVEGAEILVKPTDVADPAQCEALVAAAEEELGSVDAVVTAAATFEPVHSLDMTAEAWDECLDILLRGSLLVATAAAKRMKDKGEGRIILISSINSVVSEPETAHYSAAKAAINSLARSMAVDLADHGIAVNAVSPGWVATPMIADFVAEATKEDLARINPLARLGKPEELAGFITYLATEAPAFLTGSTLFVDGGQTAIAPMP